MANVARKDTIASLKQQIIDLKASYADERKRIIKEATIKERNRWTDIVKKVREKKNKAVKPKINREVRVAKQKERAKIPHTAAILADTRVQRIKMKIVKHIDGAIAFPIIINYSKEVGISAKEMAVLIVLCSLKEARLSNFAEWGYSTQKALYFLRKLCEYGLAERFGDNRAVYTPNLKGRKVFLGFKTYFKHTVQWGVFNEKGRVKRHEWPE